MAARRECRGTCHADRLSSIQRQMLAISGASVVLMLVLYAKGAFAPASVFLGLWFASPLVLLWLSRAVAETPAGHLDRDR